MKKEIIVNCSQEETRVAVLESGVLTDLFIERRESEKIVGNLYKGKVEAVLPGISSAFVNIGFGKNAYLNGNDVIGPTNERKIEKILSKGMDILVQVDKEPISTKGPKVTMDVSLPGRFIVYMPFADHDGISKNIEERQERSRLRAILDEIKPKTGGLIVRTEAEDATKDELKREVRYLTRLWESISRQMATKKSPSLVHRDLGIVFQTIRDTFNEQVEILLIDSKEEYSEAIDFVNIVSPELVNKVKLYTAKTPIFKAFNIEEAIKKLHSARVGLPSGGSIIIQEAESLVAIDVNTGRFTGSGSQEDTVTHTNLEAAKEIARQLRLRNIGGIIVIDFIDMKRAKNRHKVLETLEAAVKGDKAKIKILPITRLGLIEMTRERKRESLFSLLGETCPHCKGSGSVLSRESLFIQIAKELEQLKLTHHAGSIRLRLHPSVASYFKQRIDRLRKAASEKVEVLSSDDIDWEDYQIIIE
jgi:ribonuclease G